MGFYLVMPPVMDAKRGIAFLWAFLSKECLPGHYRALVPLRMSSGMASQRV